MKAKTGSKVGSILFSEWDMVNRMDHVGREILGAWSMEYQTVAHNVFSLMKRGRKQLLAN